MNPNPNSREFAGETAQEQRVGELLQGLLDSMGYRLVRVRVGAGEHASLQIMAERQNGSLSIEDCSEISKTITHIIDVELPNLSEHNLEVSSPGIARPLVNTQDLQKWQGHDVKIELKLAHPIGAKRFKGVLGPCSNGTLELNTHTNQQNNADSQRAPLLIKTDNIRNVSLVMTDILLGINPKNHKTKKNRK